jgi:hypothetical protein
MDKTFGKKKYENISKNKFNIKWAFKMRKGVKV